MNDLVRLPPTTLGPDTPGFDAAYGLVQMSRKTLRERFTAAELEALGYKWLDEARWANGGPFAPTDIDLMPTLHQTLERAMQEREMATVRAVLETGLRTDLEAMNYGYDPTGEEPPQIEDITAMVYATLLDSEHRELRLLPLLAQFGDIHQVDTHGRTLIAYAHHPLVIGFLLEAGVRLDVIDEDDVPVTEYLGPRIARVIETMVLERALPAGRTRDAVPRL
ncbi:hypothetical protein KPL74_08875 [Bacillus sp. NP157]|nr:hypothetical protein KPL74_08875 [Bacillus sp. NP157]